MGVEIIYNKSAVFTFTDIHQVDNSIIKEIIKLMPKEEIIKALNREAMPIRKRFYENWPSLDEWQRVNEKIKNVDVELPVKIKTQEKMLAIIATRPEYQYYRFQSRFASYEGFIAYLTEYSSIEEPYGFATEDVPRSSFYKSDKGEQWLREIQQKNKNEGYESFRLPKTNIQLVNYSVCPSCSRIYSFNETLRHYMNPKLDSTFKKGIEAQLRQDTRMFCRACKKYFLPSLLVVDGIKEGIVRNEVQFLSKMQTLNAIEDHYEDLGYVVLTRDEGSLLRKDGVTTRETRNLDENARSTFIMDVLNSKNSDPTSKILKGIRSDIFIKELESSPMLINNLLQYSSKPDTVLDLISGTNVEKGDSLFGIWL